MYPPTTSTMRIDRIEPSRRRKDRVLVFLEGGDLLREQCRLRFHWVRLHCLYPVSYTHLTLPTNSEV